MQKFIFIEAHVGGDNGLKEVNLFLEQGWKVIEINASKPTEDLNIHLVVLLEKEDSVNKE